MMRTRELFLEFTQFTGISLPDIAVSLGILRRKMA